MNIRKRFTGFTKKLTRLQKLKHLKKNSFSLNEAVFGVFTPFHTRGQKIVGTHHNTTVTNHRVGAEEKHSDGFVNQQSHGVSLLGCTR